MRANMKKITENHLLPFMKQKIRTLEDNVNKTHKGFKNRFVSAFGLKAPERGENDGLKSNYRMNKSELELRNLVDVAFVLQDYETAYNNASLPLKEFKKYKAHRYAASC